MIALLGGNLRYSTVRRRKSLEVTQISAIRTEGGVNRVCLEHEDEKRIIDDRHRIGDRVHWTNQNGTETWLDHRLSPMVDPRKRHHQLAIQFESWTRPNSPQWHLLSPYGPGRRQHH